MVRCSTRALMERNGIARAAREAGADVRAFEEAGWDGFYEERPTVEGTWAGPVMLPAVLREVDHIVLMPRCSRHVLAGSTLGLEIAQLNYEYVYEATNRMSNQIATHLAGTTSASHAIDRLHKSVTLSEIERCSVSRCRSVISSNVVRRWEDNSASCRRS